MDWPKTPLSPNALNNQFTVNNKNILEEALSSDSDSIDDDVLRSVDAFSAESDNDEVDD